MAMEKPKPVSELFIDHTDGLANYVSDLEAELERCRAELAERNARIDAWNAWVEANRDDDNDEPYGNDPDREKWAAYWSSAI